jgi:hypothetical protein
LDGSDGLVHAFVIGLAGGDRGDPPPSPDRRKETAMAAGTEPGTDADLEHGPLDVHSPDPPEWAIQAAEEVVRPVVEPDSGGMLPWRRRTTVAPVVRIVDKFLVGTLDLRAVEFPYLLEFVRCRFEQTPDLRQAKLAGVEFDGCWLPGLMARNASSDNDITLTGSTVFGQPIDLTDGRVHGSLVLSGSRLDNPGGRTLHADRLVLSGALLANNLTSVGELRVPGVRTGGNVNLSGAQLESTVDGGALDANGLHVGGNLLCGKDRDTGEVFRAAGWVSLPSAHVVGDMSLRGAELRPGGEGAPTRGPDDSYYGTRTTLIADRIRVDGNVDFDRNFRSTGTLRLVNAHIGGSLRLSHARIDISGEREAPYRDSAVLADGTEIDGDFEARDVRITGPTRCSDVRVRGSVRMDGAELVNPGADVWSARRFSVGSTFECRGADIQGTVIMQGADFGANLDLRASTITKPGRYSRDGALKPCLDIRATTISRDLVCANGLRDGREFRAEGEIRMTRAEVGREINFDGAVLGTDSGGIALNAFGAQTQELVLTLGREPAGRVVLRQARCASLADNKMFWHAAGRVELDGFRYDALTVPIDLKDDEAVRQRLRWLRRAMQDTYSPSPYDQLASMLRANGNDEHSDTVLIEKQWRRHLALARGFRLMGPLFLVWSWLQWSMVGYGYRSVRALGWLAMLLVIGTLWFGLHHALVPIDNQDTLQWNPFLFTLDLLVPIVDFGNKTRWELTGASQWVAAALTASGWLLATTVAAGATRILRRD